MNGRVLIPSGTGTITTLTNSGTIQNTGSTGTVGESAQGVANNNTSTSLTNNGTISATGGAGSGANGSRGGYARTVDNGGTLSNLTNNTTGTINGVGGADNNFGGNGYGLYNEAVGSVGTLLNSGTIEGSGSDVGAFGSGIYNIGTVTTLTNATGGTITGTGGGSGSSSSGAGEGVGIANLGSISISNAGDITGNGGVGSLYGGGNGYGIDNWGTSASLINTATGTINGVGGTDGTMGGNGTGLYNEAPGTYTQQQTNNSNESVGSLGVVQNAGTILGTGGTGSSFMGGNGYGFDNANTLTTLQNTGSLEGQGGAGAYGGNGIGFYNEASSTVGNFLNSGTVTGTGGTGSSAGSAYGIANYGTITSVSNSGMIEGSSGIGIYNSGAITTLTNTGTINNNADGSGVYNAVGGSIGTLTNSRSGTIAGVSNAGTITTLTNAGTISGLTLASGSTLGTLNNSGIIAGDIVNNASQALVITGGTPAQYGTITGSNGAVGTLSGTSGVTFTSGTLLLNDNISSTGIISDNGATVLINSALTSSSPFIINSGMLEVGDAEHSSASFTGSVTVNSGGMLRGHGTVDGDVTVNTGGILAPGGSIGTLSITQNLTMQPGSSLVVALGSTAGSYDQISVKGSAQLNGTLLIDPTQAGGGFVAGQTYNFLNIAGNRSGNFTTVAVTGAAGKYVTLKGSFNGNNFETSLAPTTTSYGSGQFYASSLYAQNASLFDALSSPAGTGAGYWMHGIGSFGHAPHASYTYKGFVIGNGFAIHPHLIIGGAISNVFANTSDANSSCVHGTSFGAMLYSIYTLPKWTFTSTATFGHLGNNATRHLPFGDDKFATNGIYSGASLRADYQWLNTGHLFFAPYTTLSYLYTNTGNGQETRLGGLFDMHYGPVHSSLAQAGGGLTSFYKAPTHQGILTAWVGLGGLGTLGNTHARVNETVGVVGSSVSAPIASAGAFTPAAGIQLTSNNTAWKIGANWHGQFAKQANAQAFTLNGSYKF